jgi:phosphatidate cytidylyltransferase
MSQNLKKRVFTSVVLFLLLIYFNFTNFFFFGVLIACLIVCIEFSEIISKLVGGLLVKRHPKSSVPDKFNFKYFVLQFLVIFYVLFIFGGTAYELHERSGGPIFFLYVLFICFFSDIGGYAIGKSIGGKKLIKISPNKTISGTIGSFLFSLLPLLLFYNYDQYEYPLSINNFLFCLLVSLVCQLGDLFISYIKRKAKVKDSGNILPGHGGFLDRVDGIIFALPFVFIYHNGLNAYFEKFKFFFDKLV